MDRQRQGGEDGLIAAIRRRSLVRPDGVVRGIGDDAAVVRVEPGRVAVVTMDLLLEGVHFRLERSDPHALGARCLAVNLSDLAAMGARPREAFLGLALPPTIRAEAVDLFLLGFEELARSHQVNLLGGDTSASAGGLVVSITLIGDAVEDKLVYRSGARVGDRICVTGTLGDSALGLLLLERGLPRTGPERAFLVAAHERPQAQVAEGAWLAASGAAAAMMDLSDGLATDLRRLLRESGGLGATLEAGRLPLSPALQAVAAELGEDARALALGGGEDYCLLVVLRAEAAAAAAAAFARRFGRPLHDLGTVDAASGLRLRDSAGRVTDWAGRGYEHFAPAAPGSGVHSGG